MRITIFLTGKDPGMVPMRIAIFIITKGNEGSGEARESKPTDQQEKEVPMVAHIAEFSQKKRGNRGASASLQFHSSKAYPLYQLRVPTPREVFINMDMDENLVPEVEIGNDNGVGEDFQDLSDEESEVKGAISYDPAADGDAVGDEENKEEGEIAKSAVESETVKKRGAKKKLFKNMGIGAGGTTKKRLVQGFVCPRKRTHAKNGSRQGEGIKQVDDKGSLNPKPSTPKN
ncbi:unnamed protein product [Brassica rapa]|uniref:Uncharacterized protein n=2 Tax=Brassica TaxID=3705 RepID=A0A3P5ZEX8_BRACM|nr:unnamed protein product [Brassica napus]CAG7875759.1 unnamed protein product [Brassica rapa]CDY23658.1 BnaA05g17710D [Brassica napus]VDC71331.1 unnamed protein product [Brassica rapa]